MSDMLGMLILGRSPPPMYFDPGQISTQAGASRRDEGDGDGGGDDDDELDDFDDDDDDDEDDNGGGGALMGGASGDGPSGVLDEAAKDGAVGPRQSRAEAKATAKRKGYLARLRQGVGSVGGTVADTLMVNPVRQIEKAASVFLTQSASTSLEDELEQMRWEIEQEIYSKLPPENDGPGQRAFTLNPIAKALGPLQKLNHTALIYMRTAQRMFNWEDRILSFQLLLALSFLVCVSVLLGEALSLIPWHLVLEIVVRLLGVALLGPHMYFLGRQFRAQQRERDEREREYAHASKAERRAIRERHRAEIAREIGERFEREMGQRELSEAEELADLLSQAGSERRSISRGNVKLYHLLLRTRPNASHLRFRITPNKRRSCAYPLYPSEDRPRDGDKLANQPLLSAPQLPPPLTMQGPQAPWRAPDPLSSTATPTTLDSNAHVRLRVTLMHAKGLKAADRNGKSDPYVVFKAGRPPQKQKSSVVKRTLDPVWNQTFHFEGRRGELLRSGLQLSVFDHDLIGFDDALGEVNLSLFGMEAAEAMGQPYAVELPTQGVVHVIVEWEPRLALGPLEA